MYYFLILYCVFLFAGGVFVIINVMHLLAFGLQGFKTAFVVLLYLGATIAIIGYSYVLIMQYDWSQEFMLSEFTSSLMNPIL